MSPLMPETAGRRLSAISVSAFGRGADTGMIQVALPQHLRTLAQVRGDVGLHIDGPVTQRSVLDALEVRYPMLRGTIRDQVTL
jgi:hypothetical protein